MWKTVFCTVFQAAVGAVCASADAAPSTPSFAGVVSRGSRRLSKLRVRARTDPPDPRDCLGLRHAEAVLSLVPRFGLDVQPERPAAPTLWTRPSARKHVGAVIACSRSVSAAIAGTPTARPHVEPPRAGVRSPPRVSATAEVRKGASIIGIISARIASA